MQKVFFPPRCVSRLSRSSYGETRVRRNKIREIEPNARDPFAGCFFLPPSTETTRRAIASRTYLPVDVYLSIRIVFAFADSLSRAFSLAERPSRSARNQRADVRSDSVSQFAGVATRSKNAFGNDATSRERTNIFFFREYVRPIAGRPSFDKFAIAPIARQRQRWTR